MVKILSVFGTRPETIKISPVIKELRKYPEHFICRTCITSQHRQLLEPFLKIFDIKPEYDLNIMQENQSLSYITVTVLKEVGEIINKEKPDYLLVQGDTTTAMAASLAAFYQKVKVGHIEAGLRTGNKMEPFPEEINRRIIDSVSSLYFAPSQQAKNNLIQEGVSPEALELTGNTVIDALLDIANRDFNPQGTVLENIPFNTKKVILVTAHRRENFGQPLVNICNAIKEIAQRYYSSVYVVYPVHLNPNVRQTVFPILSKIDNVFLTEPLDYLVFVHLMKRVYLVLTDSGGLQEEAPSFGKPVLVLRDTTERPEVVELGAAKIVGTVTPRIVEAAAKLLDDNAAYEDMSRVVSPYGQGQASQIIVRRLLTESSKNE